ncbi:hypothetical protein K435DRAFT_273928 [Dendrothele bispora CBS 962.96]|uniref:Uncharacterized protein n=1 Tax=Dendrothele bispora (strain CBS 962.96) TaxID=1314807 RepID=A0A4S8LLR6_DENBC|nr:hypothetical protein K435DRAFT_273928 [Dendrothele bispora CBS 962.96]
MEANARKNAGTSESGTAWTWDIQVAKDFLERLKNEARSNTEMLYAAICDLIDSSKANSGDDLTIASKIAGLLSAGSLLDEYLTLLPLICPKAKVLKNHEQSSSKGFELDLIVIIVAPNGEICPISQAAKLDNPPVSNSSSLRNFIATVHEPWEHLKDKLEPRWASSVMELLRMVDFCFRKKCFFLIEATHRRFRTKMK